MFVSPDCDVRRGELGRIACWAVRQLNTLLGSLGPVRVGFVGQIIEDALQFEAPEYALAIAAGGGCPEHVDRVSDGDPVGAIIIERNRGLLPFAVDDAEVARTSGQNTNEIDSRSAKGPDVPKAVGRCEGDAGVTARCLTCVRADRHNTDRPGSRDDVDRAALGGIHTPGEVGIQAGVQTGVAEDVLGNLAILRSRRASERVEGGDVVGFEGFEPVRFAIVRLHKYTLRECQPNHWPLRRQGRERLSI
jgi:hypothetical protein